MASATQQLNLREPVAVRVSGLHRSFNGQRVLDGIDIEIRKGEFLALLGRSGSGKSTILRAIAGLDEGAEGSGEITVPERRSVLFQDSRLLPWQTVIDNVTLGSYDTGARDRAKIALREVELSGKEGSWPRTLSGGEQQRAALARSLVRDPELLLADEPFSALDALTRIRMQRLLQRLCQRHSPAVLFVTHDVEEALRLADRVIIISDGRVSHEVTTRGLNTSPDRFSATRDDILARLGLESTDHSL